jgi:formylglycine-generating enzyme required for sulfatase activity
MDLRKKIKIIFIFLFVAMTIVSTRPAAANNLSIKGIMPASLANANSGGILIYFQLSWENSWKDATNYDAAWVFLKYSTDAGSTWYHATLGPTSYCGTSLGSCSAPGDRKGAFFYRSANATGTFTATNNTTYLIWDYLSDGVTAEALASKNFRVQIIGIEMVYVPTANFYLGDGDGGANYSYCSLGNSSTQLPQQITTSASTVVQIDCGSPEVITIDGDGGVSSDAGDSNTGYPTGYSAFYLMKYEITEGLWVTFFNTLTAAQKANRDITSSSGKGSDSTVYRNTISWTGTGDATTTRPNRAMGYLNWPDLCAIADWAGLRPITELEYEKACRGPTAAVTYEYAWGSATATTGLAISGTENGTETITTASANYASRWTTAYTGGDAGTGPVRAGIFATGSSTRVLAGAGYYGNMELSGNVYEMVVSVLTSAGRAFDGTSGDGILTTVSGSEGNATNTDWPGINPTSSRGVTGFYGAGMRGDSTASDRSFASLSNINRNKNYGGRLARTP